MRKFYRKWFSLRTFRRTISAKNRWRKILNDRKSRDLFSNAVINCYINPLNTIGTVHAVHNMFYRHDTTIILHRTRKLRRIIISTARKKRRIKVRDITNSKTFRREKAESISQVLVLLSRRFVHWKDTPKGVRTQLPKISLFDIAQSRFSVINIEWGWWWWWRREKAAYRPCGAYPFGIRITFRILFWFTFDTFSSKLRVPILRYPLPIISHRLIGKYLITSTTRKFCN